MQFRFGTLCDYAGDGANGKLIIVGLFDTVHDQLKVRPIPWPPCYLVALFEASIVEGTQHNVTVKFQTFDQTDDLLSIDVPLRFIPQGPGRLTKANLAIHFGQFTVPELGEYVFAFSSGHQQLGSVEVHVQEPLVPGA